MILGIFCTGIDKDFKTDIARNNTSIRATPTNSKTLDITMLKTQLGKIIQPPVQVKLDIKIHMHLANWSSYYTCKRKEIIHNLK